jgi:hypothetical protein
LIGGAKGARRVGELTYQFGGRALSIAMADVLVSGFGAAGDLEDGFEVPAFEDCADCDDAHFDGGWEVIGEFSVLSVSFGCSMKREAWSRGGEEEEEKLHEMARGKTGNM